MKLFIYLNMFKTKYNVTLLDSKWNPIKNNIIFNVIPRKYEYIYYIDRYYHVINVIHNIGKKHGIIIIVEELINETIDIQQSKKLI
jgi:hypothetical protein